MPSFAKAFQTLRLHQSHQSNQVQNLYMMKKRIIVCCDGTWQNSDNGYVKPTASNPIPSLQIPSNVTRISRAFKSNCSDGTFQIIYYQSGVGSTSGIVNRIVDGAFGIGIAENIREAYSYICANYVDGDEIVLIGFSRGAFTARSVGGMISDLGLLTREGMEFFYPIFRDMQNWMNSDYKDQFPQFPFPNKPKGPHAADEYRRKLVEKAYTRSYQGNDTEDLIKVTAIGVWDTVGSLGIPRGKAREILGRLGVRTRYPEYRFYNTRLSNRIEHGFHALALDETRRPFSPTLWEHQPEGHDSSNLRQVWFPGTHGNIGGGWNDQGVANINLAWMMDQLSSVGCEFKDDALDKLHDRNVEYYHSLKPKRSKGDMLAEYLCGYNSEAQKTPLPWAAAPIFDPNKPVRPWSLHAIQSVNSPIYNLTGSVTRSPGMYKKTNPENGHRLRTFLEDTNERIHSSVRVRLACEGLGLNDSDIWACPALLKLWRPRRAYKKIVDPIPQDASWGPNGDNNRGRQIASSSTTTKDTAAANAAFSSAGHHTTDHHATDHHTTEHQTTEQGDNTLGQLRWVWEYVGPEIGAPFVRTLVEESMGPWERHLLKLSTGTLQIYNYAEAQDVTKFKAFESKVFAKSKEKESKKPNESSPEK